MSAPVDHAAIAEARIRAAADNLIATQRAGLRVAYRNASDRWQREEVRQCLEKIEAHARRIYCGEMFAADHAVVALGPNQHGPRIDAAIAAGARRSPSPTHLTAGGR